MIGGIVKGLWDVMGNMKWRGMLWMLERKWETTTVLEWNEMKIGMLNYGCFPGAKRTISASLLAC